ncbi:MAG TPA: class I adenylate-forming enzyme family protein [Opitutaceae bacterium]|nr:class I adenylate-forming enzyme family protein [Opitutaceae bacterium]
MKAKPRTLLAAWESTVRAAPRARALIDAASGRAWTRAELDELAETWRAAHGSGIAGQTVIFSELNGVGWFTVFLGLLKSDAVAAAMDPGEPLAAQRATAVAINAAFLWCDGRLEQVAPAPRKRGDGRRVVKLTSGSTGTPKAIAFTDAQMLADGRQVCASMGIGPRDLNFALIPLGHSYGLGNLVVPLLAQGTALVCGSAAWPHAIAADIARWRPTMFPAVPALLRGLSEATVPAAQLRSLRTVISAGAALSPEIAQTFQEKYRRKIHSFYGSSETGGITYDRTGDAAAEGRSVGRTMKGVRLLFGRGGRFLVASQAVFTLGNRRRHGALGAFRPADVGALNPRGELVLKGRTGRFVKIAGRRLNLAEVEQALKQLTGVRGAFVAMHAGRADSVAAVVAGARTGIELKLALRERLAAWKIPRQFVVVPEMPLTARGKTDTRRLIALLAQAVER